MFFFFFFIIVLVFPKGIISCAHNTVISRPSRGRSLSRGAAASHPRPLDIVKVTVDYYGTFSVRANQLLRVIQIHPNFEFVIVCVWVGGVG